MTTPLCTCETKTGLAHPWGHDLTCKYRLYLEAELVKDYEERKLLELAGEDERQAIIRANGDEFPRAHRVAKVHNMDGVGRDGDKEYY